MATRRPWFPRAFAGLAAGLAASLVRGRSVRATKPARSSAGFAKARGATLLHEDPELEAVGGQVELEALLYKGEPGIREPAE